MKAFRSLWATYDLTSFSLCELVKSFATKALKYTRKGHGLGLFSSTVWSFLSSTLYSFILTSQFQKD